MNIFTFLKSRVSILEVVGEYSQLKKAGLYWKGHCPFHNEKTASFTVSPHKEIFYCFGCSMGGDVVSFIGKVENCSPIEAAHHLIDRYGIEVPEEVGFDARTNNGEQHKGYNHLCEKVAQWCHENLKKAPGVMRYLQQRGIDQTQIDYFKLGYFPGGLRAIKMLTAAMNKQSILADDLLAAHILSQGKTVMYSPFEERIIFPITDHLGRFCGFGGRTFQPTDERAKYYNSRENTYFSKGSLLFGLDLAKKAIQKDDAAFLVEGYTDCIAMAQHGFKNTVATLGTACTADHLKILSRYAGRLFVLYDNDKAGIQAIMRLAQLCWHVSMDLSVVCLPQGEDPASYLQADNDLKQRIDAAQPIFEFFISTLGADFATKSLGEKLKLVRTIVQTLSTVEDPLKQDILLQSAATTLNMPFASLKQELARVYARPLKAMHSEPEEAEKAAPTAQESEWENLPKLEKAVFLAILHTIKSFDEKIVGPLITYLPEPLHTVLATLLNAKQADPELDFTQFFSLLAPHEQHHISKMMLEQNDDVQQEDLDNLLAQVRKKYWKRIVHDTTLKITQAKQQADEQTVKKLLDDFLELKKKLIKEGPRT